jgi:putative DNA primase/helicase
MESGMVDSASISQARAVRVAHEIHRRGIRLRRSGRELVGACPVCGDGGKGNRSDRFAVHVVKNTWNCRRCPAGGSVIDLVMHLDGVAFHEAVAILTDGRRHVSPPPHATAAPPAMPSADAHRRAMLLWNEAVPIAGTLAERYLRATRRLTVPSHVGPRVLRFHLRCPFGQGVRHPCLIALYRDIRTDAPAAIMRTALTPNAHKIGRKALGGVEGAAIKLSDDAEVTAGLTVAEGLETGLAGLVRGFSPAWALGSAGAIARFPVLQGVEALTILAETNDDGANARAVRECAGRWLAAGREVFTATSLIGADMNDAVMTTGTQGEAA